MGGMEGWRDPSGGLDGRDGKIPLEGLMGGMEGWRNPSGKIDGTGGIDGRDGGIPPESTQELLGSLLGAS